MQILWSQLQPKVWNAWTSDAGLWMVTLCQASTVFTSFLLLGQEGGEDNFALSKWTACSIRFRSGDWLGHCITHHSLALRNSLVTSAVRFGSLSICTVQKWSQCPNIYGWGCILTKQGVEMNVVMKKRFLNLILRNRKWLLCMEKQQRHSCCITQSYLCYYAALMLLTCLMLLSSARKISACITGGLPSWISPGLKMIWFAGWLHLCQIFMKWKDDKY